MSGVYAMPDVSVFCALQLTATALCRDIAERALRVLRKQAEKYTEVRSRLATVEGLQAAAMFQKGLQQPHTSEQSPPASGVAFLSCWLCAEPK